MARVTRARSGFRIRPMDPADVSQVSAIERDCFGSEAWPAQAFRDLLTTFADSRLPRGAVWVAEAASTREVVGYAGVEVSALAGEMDIINIAVAAAHRRHGIGRALLEKTIKQCRDTGVPLLWLRVRASNTAAQAFYADMGFDRRGEFARYYIDPDESAIIMAMDI